MKKIRSLLRQPKYRYLLIGGSVYLLEIIVILVAQHADVRPTGAVALSFCIGTTVSFLLQKFVTFGDKRKHRKVIAKQAAAYGLLVLANFLFTVWFVAATNSFLPATFGRTIALGITTVWNFYIYKTHIFNPKKAKKSAKKGSLKRKADVSKLKHSATYLKIKSIIGTKLFTRSYMLVSLAVLFGTAISWAKFGAALHGQNADQLVDPYLFESPQTLHGAEFPAAHSFLLKWPLFWLVKSFGFSQQAFQYATVAAVLITVTAMVLFMYWLERRPLVFGTACLALASVLLMVPATPYVGALLPVNMAMLATRNIEYVLYAVGLCLIVLKQPNKQHRYFVAGVVLLGVLFASDKLFLTYSLGGSILTGLGYALFRNKELVRLAQRWLYASILAAVGSYLLIWLVKVGNITKLSANGSANPYGLVTNLHDIFMGLLYAILAIFTNFGASPIVNPIDIGAFPHQLIDTLVSSAALILIVNGLILLVAMWAAWRHVRLSVPGKGHRLTKLDVRSGLATMLLATSVVAFAAYVATDHYYPVDARYLAIVLFAGFVCGSLWLRTKKIDSVYMVGAGAVICLAMLMAIPVVHAQHVKQVGSLDNLSQRNTLITQALKSHPVDTLVGDYWRVLPIKSVADGPVRVTPLGDCLTPLKALSSSQWQLDLNKHSFAYLLSFNGSLTNYPKCSPEQIVKTYGEPSSTVLVAGTTANPQELLLFYDHGSRPYTHTPSSTPALLPIPLKNVSQTECKGTTDMNIVAHEDDDLLFMNPDVLHALHSGNCQRTVYITAGDAGGGEFYWLRREQGSEAAYSAMLGDPKLIWTHQTISLGTDRFVTVASPSGHSEVSLIFMHLPDGNMHSNGFPASHFESIGRLATGGIPEIHSIDAQSVYSEPQLRASLESLMAVYKPAHVRTQADQNGRYYPDHGDHMAAGKLATAAYDQYMTDHPDSPATISHYLGYVIHERPENISGQELEEKSAVFFSYAQFDGATCNSAEQCASTVYGAYLPRMYRAEQAEVLGLTNE